MKKLILAAILIASLSFAADIETSGFVDARYGIRTQSDPNSDQETLNELRLQLSSIWYHDLFTLTARSDFLVNGVANSHDRIDLETGEGPIDLRELNVLFTPVDWADVKIGRQILTWGTGDLLFINDLFSKDWKSFFAGRDEEYLKAPSDALFMSFFPSFATIDVAYMPRFDSDRFIDGERFSYWGGTGLTGTDLQTDKPNDWFNDDEIAVRVYRTFKGVEFAGYLYDGFWKTPQGFDPLSGQNTFPKLTVYGASARGALAGGIANLEAGYYDSRDDRNSTDPFIPDSQVRLLAGYEHELATDLTGSAQYYLEHTPDTDHNRHVMTVRLTQRLMNQNLTLGLFTYWSPSDQDGYLRPSAAYKLTDNWLLEARGNFFFGKNNSTFFGQFADNNNVALAVRYSF
ncbi:MAG: hypothetical protein H8E68_03570 [Kiritimatiellaeota bacterium]|nr:hypothetical protein [Kiritimatiellota bacterium]